MDRRAQSERVLLHMEEMTAYLYDKKEILLRWEKKDVGEERKIPRMVS